MYSKMKLYLKKSLCGILSAAMILTGSSLSGLTVHAEETNVEDAVQTDETDGITDVTPSDENDGAVQNPDVTDNTDGNEDGTDGDDADQNDSNGQEQTGDDDETLPDDDEEDGTEEQAPEDDDTSDDDMQPGDTKDGETDDEEEVSDEKTVFGVEDGVYENVTVEFNFYYDDLTADEEIGFCPWGTVTTDGLTPLEWKSWSDAVYEMKSVEGYTNWYSITFQVTDTVTSEKSNAGFVIYKSSAPTVTGGVFECSGYPDKNTEIYIGLLSGEITAVKDGVGYASIADAMVSTDKLVALVDEAKKLKEEDYKAAGWKVFAEALTAAEEVLAKDAPTSDEVQTAYENLEKAMEELVPKTVVEAEINVKPVALADDFITGADISSYWSLRQSGTVFKDEEGNELSDAEFFKYLHDGGTNWIRIRVWNDPYDSNKNGYGGGNNDLDKAKIMGKLATDAGMRVLIDFHYSDFWADPGKQQAPKAWAGMSVDEKAEAVYQFTKDSLNELKSAGVDVGMVQVGNETTNGICGVFYSSDGWAEAAKIYNAGSKAVREFDENCLVAIHFTNPERSGNYANFAKNLDAQKVDYDVFASSYYPFWHGTTENLTSVLANVAKTYGKKVMVAETSWATTLDDQDGHDNTVRKGANDTNQPYAFSLQGQADEIRAVVEAANNINNVEGAAGSSIGVFYWESAWLSPYYVYKEDGSKNEELLNKNKAVWEQYGSGWAASYGGDYDPEDAGKWYGGSAVDNQAWFGFDGAALPTAKIYSYIRTGAETEKAVSDVENPFITINAGETVDYPEKVTVTFNDGTSAECPVEWNQEDQAELDTNEPGDHTVRGIATCEYTISDGSIKTATRSVTLTITVEMALVAGLINPGFEDADMSAWTITGSGTARKNEDPRTGTYGVHFYNASAVTSIVMQKIENLDAGTYIFGGYIQGDALGTTAEAVAKVYDSAGTLKDTKTASCTTAGWCVWQNPEVVGIVVAEGDYLEVGMEVNAAAAGWGTIDDFYLYQAYEYDILVDDQIKNGKLTSSAEKAVSGETITLTASPDTGYALYQLKVSGRSVTGDTLTSDHGTVTYDEKTKTAVLTYSDKIVEATEESFTMPNSKVTVSAVFRTDVDTSALDELVTTYEKVTNDGYTEESWKAFTDALEVAKAVAENVDATQDEIDNAKDSLEAAYVGLTKAPAGEEEIEELSALIVEYKKVTNDGYTEESWKNFQDALAAAEAAIEKENVTKTEITRAKEVLETARKGLVKPGEVDLSGLTTLIEEYEKVTNDGYTEESWKKFTDTLAEAKKVASKEGVTQTEADNAKAALEEAKKGLIKPGEVDLSGLTALIEEYEKITNDDYTEESWKKFTDALEEAKKVVSKEGVTQTEVDNAKSALEVAKKGLVKPGEVNLAELNAMIEEYEKVTNDGYTEESWKKFTDALAEAKKVASKEGVTQTEVDNAKVALETARKGLIKPGEVDLSELNALIEEYEKVTSVGYTEESWKKFADALTEAEKVVSKEGVTQTEVDNAKAALETAYRGLIREGLWAEWTDEWADILSSDNAITYTGKAIKPTVNVYDGETLLSSKSYSVSYKDNTKVGQASVVIKGKGNYTGSDILSFKIKEVDLETDENVNIPDLYVAASKNGNPVSVKPAVTWNGKKVNAKMYEVVLSDPTAGAYVNPGTYDVEVKAKKDNGIYTGSKMIQITLADSEQQVLMSSVKIKLNFKSKEWVESGVELSDNDITVTYQNENLVRDVNYTLEYKNHTGIGTATVIVKGTGTPENGGRFVGEQSKTFKIVGTAIKSKDVKLATGPFTYNGARHEPEVTIEGLHENSDFKVEYHNNINAGKKATAVITGINGYSGTIKKTFTIGTYSITGDDVNIVVAGGDSTVPYEKGGSKPDVNVTFSGTGDLVQGTDYTLTYSKNTKVTDGSTAIVKIKGKGNFKDTETRYFAIKKQDLGKMVATAADQTSVNKWNKVSPVITDKENGKTLKKGTDYDKTFTYALYDVQGNLITDITTTPPAVGMRVEITVTADNSAYYEGKTTAEFRIIDSKQSIAKARITIKPQTYTGEEIELNPEDITLEIKEGNEWKALSTDEYEILGYTNNINKGKAAKVTIHGLAPYGGTKTFKFEIQAQSMEGMDWAGRIASLFKTILNK